MKKNTKKTTDKNTKKQDRESQKKDDIKKTLNFFRKNESWLSVLQNVSTVIIVLVLLSLITNNISTHSSKSTKEIPFSTFAQNVASGTLSKIVVEGSKVSAQSGKTEYLTKKEEGASVVDMLKEYGVTLKDRKDVTITVKEPSDFWYWFFGMMPIVLPFAIIGFFLYMMTRQMKVGGMQAMSFGQSRARMQDPNNKNTKVVFADVAGVQEAKEELQEVVDFLKHPKKFHEIGAQIPKGVLLFGPPGTGKTLLARAVAGEANVPFFSISGSEFVEMFVGVGASRVRDLFATAKKVAPAIIFIDEIDAVGRSRGVGLGGGNDEREQTLNQILVEMDGFEPNQQVIVMAATNRSDVLDEALLRPGRFDRRVKIDLPDVKDREQILGIHTKTKPLSEAVELASVAKRTPGFSGAELYSLANEAAILAAREDKKTIEQDHLYKAVEKVILGPERKSFMLTEEEKKITAYHEAGHAVVAAVLPYADPVHKISIISRGNAAGYVLHMPDDDKKFRSRNQFYDEMAMALGGYVAEMMVFGDITKGPSSDLQHVTTRARDMVTRFGMSDIIGPIALESDTSKKAGVIPSKEYSQDKSSQIDKEVDRLIKDAYQKATQVLTKHKEFFEAVAQRLLKEETLERDQFEAMMSQFDIPLKKHNPKKGLDITQDTIEQAV